MKAALRFYEKLTYDDCAVMEMKIWQLPEKDHDFPEGIRYSLFYGYPGQPPLVLYDIHRGKGHHRHIEGKQGPYRFTTPQRLIADFTADVQAQRAKP